MLNPAPLIAARRVSWAALDWLGLGSRSVEDLRCPSVNTSGLVCAVIFPSLTSSLTSP